MFNCFVKYTFISIYQLLSKKNESPKEDLACTFFLSYFLGKILQVSKALKNWDTAFKYALVKYQTYLWLWHVSKHLSLLGKRLVKVLLYLSRTENHLTLQRCNLPWISLGLAWVMIQISICFLDVHRYKNRMSGNHFYIYLESRVRLVLLGNSCCDRLHKSLRGK